MKPRTTLKLLIAGVLSFVLLVGGCAMIQTVPAGHGAVATLFGDVVDRTYEEGLHFPVNPLASWTYYDCRDKSLACPAVEVPTRDQQTSTIDFSVQYRINKASIPAAKSEVGTAEDIVAVKINPNLRSLVRSEGKAVARCEELFDEGVQATMQINLQERLQTKVGDYAIISAVLVRNVNLPTHIKDAIRSKKVREQLGEEQKAELKRYETEQQQKIAEATANRKASEEKAQEIRTLADAEAYEIEQINAALADSPAFIRLRALETLIRVSENPATQIYFLNGDSPDPLPLMHIGAVGSVGSVTPK
jgi:regulator of protease activity HflC (stomatin/prohibitin superfamily)